MSRPKLITRHAVIAAACAVMLAPAAVASAATSPSSFPSAVFHLKAPAALATGMKPVSTVVCTGQADNPHYSRGAGGVIFKVRLTCDGAAEITFRGILADGPHIGPPVPRASTTQARAVTAGVTETFYTPPSGEKGVTCESGLYYQGYGSVSIAGGTTDDYQSSKITVKCP